MICGLEHDTKMHSCKDCNSKTICPHTILNCANCGGGHQANDPTCEVARALAPKTMEIDELEL